MASCEKKYTILLLSAPIGSGHKLAAQALEQSFALAENVCVVHGSVFDFFPGSIGKAFLSFYLWVLSYCPWLYELAYKWGNRQSGSLWLRNLINSILAGLAQDFLTRTNPDAVIATHATPAGIMAIYKKKFKPDLLLGAVVTDYTVHKWWLCEGVDVYFSAAENLLPQFAALSTEVLPTGIPVRRQFYQEHDRQELRRKFNWSEQDIVCLLMGGGEGLLPMESIVKAFHGNLPQHLKIIAVAGHNEGLQHRLEIFKEVPLTVYGFTDDVPELLLAADIVVTKAGGLTAAETLIAGCSYIIYKPLPGQETGNAVYLEQYCGAQVAQSPQEVKTMVCRYAKLAAPVRLAERQQRSRKYGKPEAARKISDYILKKLEK